MKNKDIKELSPEETRKKIRDTRHELLNLRVRKQAGQLERPSEILRLRREIARFETFLKQKQATRA